MQKVRYTLGVRHSEGFNEDIGMNPVLTLAQLGLLTHEERKIVHRNMEEGEFREIRSKGSVFP